jgi:murein L,D-transpeptidase YafK
MSAMGASFKLVRVVASGLMCLSLAACMNETALGPKHLKQVSDNTKRQIIKAGFQLATPMFVRIFKEEEQLEVWLRYHNGQFGLFKTYKICNWSGVLGPKLKTGDKQAPEGFYMISPAQMNPKSSFHLAFNLGYPNAYDRSHKRTGAHLMVHGGCSSAGCYAVTDEAVQEIYALGRDAFFGGQRSFHVHSFPFRMTEKNMKKHAKNKWIGFWRNLKTGYDFFQKNRVLPVVAVHSKNYVFFSDYGELEKFKSKARRSRNRQRTVLITGWSQASYTDAHAK